jgi:exonuclease III
MVKILSWNCDGGFFTKEYYKNILKHNADILIIQECSDPDKALSKEILELYPRKVWLPDYKQDEVLLEGRTVKDIGIGIFSREENSLKKLSWETECDHDIIWWKDDKVPETPIIRNKRLRGFNPVSVYIKEKDLLLTVLGVHTKTGISYDPPNLGNKIGSPNDKGQMRLYLEKNGHRLKDCKKERKGVIIAGDLNTGFRDNEKDRKKYYELIEPYRVNWLFTPYGDSIIQV